MSQAIENPVIGLFDNDSAGIKEFRRFNKYSKADGTEYRLINRLKKIYCGLIPQPIDYDEPIRIVKETSGNDSTIPVPIEFLFTSEVINRAVEQNVLVLSERTTTAQDTEFSTQVNLTILFSNNLPEEYHYLTYKIDDDSKNRFSEWVADLPAEAFENFAPLFHSLNALIENDQV